MPKVMLLPVKITDPEKLRITDEVSAMLTEVEALEKEKKRIPEAIKTLMGSVHLKNHALAAGVIEREVEIREEFDIFAAKVKRFRVDTGEQLPDREMDKDERQMHLGDNTVPGPTPDNVRSLAEARAKTEEQLAAGTPEEAEALREARLADERAQRVEETIAGLTVEVIDRGDETFVAHVRGEIPGVPGSDGFPGPIRSTAQAARADLYAEVRRAIVGAGGPAVTQAEADANDAEIQRLAEEQAADDAGTKPKRGLKVPKGSKAEKARRTKKLKVTDENDKELATGDNPNGVDTTPPPPSDGGAPLTF